MFVTVFRVLLLARGLSMSVYLVVVVCAINDSDLAGAHTDKKSQGLCHGTSGNGLALLKAFASTGDERWLGCACRFAITHWYRQSGSRLRMAGAATHSSQETLAPHSSPPPASISTRASR